MITIVGMGIGEDGVTLKGASAMERADIIIAASDKHTAYKYIKKRGFKHITLDRVYETAENMSEVTERALSIVRSYADVNTVFAVDGAVSENEIALTLMKNLQCAVIEGVSKTAYASEITGVGLNAVSYGSRYVVESGRSFYHDSAAALIIRDIDDMLVASAVKEQIARVYGEERPIFFVSEREVKKILAYELDRQSEYDYSTTAVLPPLELTDKTVYNHADLTRIMLRLRDRVSGCKWDIAQTHDSLRANLIEESYELCDAIDAQNLENMCEEIGDLLLQCAFHCDIADETGEFYNYEPITMLCRKLIFRHKHIFGDKSADNAAAAYKVWEAAKAEEKGYTSLADAMRSIANALPQTERACKLQKTASKTGFDGSASDFADYVKEELDELISANCKCAELEAGDLLFAAVNVLRKMKISPELALKRANDKFLARFDYMEKAAGKRGTALSDMTISDMDELWKEAKETENI